MLKDKNDVSTLVRTASIASVRGMIREGIIAGGMIPKARSPFFLKTQKYFLLSQPLRGPRPALPTRARKRPSCSHSSRRRTASL